MPFDASGNYSLPQAPFVTNTIISPTVMNSQLTDIASALTVVDKAALALSASGMTSFQNRTDGVAATIAANVNYVVLMGYTTAGDCDGIPAVFIRGTTPTQGSFVSADGQRWILQNKNPHVMMFGAVGDGATDDSTAILNAVAFVKTNSTRGGTIWFSAKTYAIGSTITIGDGTAAAVSTYNGITLASMVGVGASATEFTADTQGTVLKWIGAANGTAVQFVGPIHSCGLTNICINGNKTCSTNLNLLHSYKGNFTNVLIKQYSQNNATDIGLKIQSRALFAGITNSGSENTFTNLHIKDAGNSTGKALVITGSKRNLFQSAAFSIPGTGIGIVLQSTADTSCQFNTFIRCRITQENVGTGTAINTDDVGATGCSENTIIGLDQTDAATNTQTSSPGYNAFNTQFDHGHVRLTRSAASTLKLAPFNGNGLLINGVGRVVPNAGVTLALAGLVATTLYYVYAYWNGTTVVLETSTTAYATDTSYGNAVKSGDGTRSLVGLIRATAVNDTADTAGQRFVASWFESPMRTCTGVAFSGSLAGAALTEVGNGTTNRAQWVQFSGRGGYFTWQGYGSMDATSTGAVQMGFTASATSDTQLLTSATTAYSLPFSTGQSSAALTEGFQYAYPLARGDGVNTLSFAGSIQGWII